MTPKHDTRMLMICLQPPEAAGNIPLSLELITEQLEIVIIKSREEFNSSDSSSIERLLIWAQSTREAVAFATQVSPENTKFWIISDDRPLFSDLLGLHLESLQATVLIDDVINLKLRDLACWLEELPPAAYQQRSFFGFPLNAKQNSSSHLHTIENRSITVDEFTRSWETQIHYLYLVSRIIKGTIPDFMQFLATEIVADAHLTWNQWADLMGRFDHNTRALLQILCLSDGHPEAVGNSHLLKPKSKSFEEAYEYSVIRAARKCIERGDVESAKELLTIPTSPGSSTLDLAITRLGRNDSDSAVSLLVTAAYLSQITPHDLKDDRLLERISPRTLIQLGLELLVLELTEHVEAINSVIKSPEFAPRLPNQAILSGLITRIVKETKTTHFLKAGRAIDICNQNSNTFYDTCKLTAAWQLIYHCNSDFASEIVSDIEIGAVRETKQIKILSGILLALREYDRAQELITHASTIPSCPLDLDGYQLRLEACALQSNENFSPSRKADNQSDESRFWSDRISFAKGDFNQYKRIDHDCLDSTIPTRLTLKLNEAIALREEGETSLALKLLDDLIEKHPAEIVRWLGAFETVLTHLYSDRHKQAEAAATRGCNLRSSMMNNRLNPCFFLKSYLIASSSPNQTAWERFRETASFCKRNWMAPQFGIQNWAEAFEYLSILRIQKDNTEPEKLFPNANEGSFEQRLIEKLANQQSIL